MNVTASSQAAKHVAPHAGAPTCFVIGPIGDRLAMDGSPDQQVYEDAVELYERVILAACRPMGIEPVRADHIVAVGSIDEQILHMLEESDIVIADLTDMNRNTLFELGIRHGARKATIVVGKTDNLPFSLQTTRIIRLDRATRSGLIDARRELQAMLENFVQVGLLPIARSEAPPAPMDGDQPGLFEAIAEVEEGMAEMTGDMQALESAMGTLTEQMSRFGADFDHLSSPGHAQGAQLAMMQFADAIEAPSAEAESASSRIAKRVEALDAAVLAALEFSAAVRHDPRVEGIETFLDEIIASAAMTQEAAEGLRLFEAMAGALGQLSRRLRSPASKLAHTSRQLSAVILRMTEWRRRAIAIKES